jgi:hypothetical protein
MSQAGKKIRQIVLLEVGTALSADRMRPARLQSTLGNIPVEVNRSVITEIWPEHRNMARTGWLGVGCAIP